MKKTFSSVTLLLILVIPLATMFVGTKEVGASSSYNSEAAVNYAETWWNGRNPAYHDYGDYDCANFVSQCLIAGGLNLGICPYVDAWGCIPSCDNLHQYLVNYLGAQHEVMRRGEAEPPWFSKGDPAIFGDDSDNWRHAVFAVAEDESDYARCNAHSQNVHHIAISSFFEANPDFTLCNYYHISAQEPLELELRAMPNPTRDIDGATISAHVTSGGKPIEGAYVEFSFEPGAPPHNGFDDDDDPNTPPVAEISGTTNELGEFQAHWGYYDVCIIYEQIITFRAVTSKEGYTSASDSCTLNVLPLGEAPYPEPLYGEVTMTFPCGPHNVYATLSPATGIITSGQTVYFDIQIGREIDYESIEELDWDAIWMIPVFKNTVGLRSETNTVTVSLPDTHAVQAEAIDDEVMVEVKHSLLSDDWIPISGVEDMNNIISLVTWLRRLNAVSKGNWIGLAAGFIPDAIATLATALYGEELGHGPEGDPFDPNNEDVALNVTAFGVGKFGVEGFRIRLPVKFFGEGTIDVNFHVAFAFVSHNQYVLNYAGAQFEPLSFTVRRTPLDLIFTIDTTGSMWDDIANVKASASAIVEKIDAETSNYRIAVVDYRDFPVYPYGGAGDYPFNDVLPFSSDKSSIIAAIQGLTLGWGADWQESVYSALMHSIDSTSLGGWRGSDKAAKIIILMGDAPPHDPEPFTGYTLSTVTDAAEKADPVHIYPIQIGGTVGKFEEIAEQTGGRAFTAESAGEVVDTILEALEVIAKTPIAEAGPDQTAYQGDIVTLDGSGSYDPDGTIVLYEWDAEGDGTYEWSSSTTAMTTHVYETTGTYHATLRITDNDGLQDTDFAVITVEKSPDEIPPTTTLLIGEPHYVDPLGNVYVSSTTAFTLTAEDNPGGTGVAKTYSRVYNSSYDTGWREYSAPFYLADFADGEYSIDYYSTDNIGNTEPTHTISITLDNSGPAVTIENPPPGWALMDGVNFIASATDPSGTVSLNFSIREANGDQGIPVGFEDIPATYNATTGKWEFFFDTLQLPDGFYIVLVSAEDNLRHTASITVPYSIRNWAVLELLPATPNSKAGRTMPVKFALRVAASVDPNQPFVCNEELTIKIYATDNPSNILQTSTFGDTARDYRINTLSEHYITNFKTLKTPKTYMVEIWRKDMLIGTIQFSTVK